MFLQSNILIRIFCAAEINSSPQAAKINATSISNILEFNVLGNKNEKMVTDFASLAAQNSGDFTFGKNSGKNMY